MNYCGLARLVRGRFTKPSFDPPPPGWRHLKVPDRHVMYEMPAWLHYFARLHREWRWLVFGTATALRFWQLREDGGYWTDGRLIAPDWIYRPWYCFTHDTDTAPTRPDCFGGDRYRLSPVQLREMRRSMLCDAFGVLVPQ